MRATAFPEQGGCLSDLIACISLLVSAAIGVDDGTMFAARRKRKRSRPVRGESESGARSRTAGQLADE